MSGLDRRAPAWPRASRPATSQSLQSLSYAVFSSRHAHHSHILTMPKADCFVQYTSSSAAAPSPTCLLPLDAAPRALSSSFSVPFIHSAAVSDSATLFSRVVTLSSFQLSFTARGFLLSVLRAHRIGIVFGEFAASGFTVRTLPCPLARNFKVISGHAERIFQTFPECPTQVTNSGSTVAKSQDHVFT